MNTVTFASVVCLTTACAALAARPTEESFIPNYSAASLQGLWGSRSDLKDTSDGSMMQYELGVLAQYPVYRSDETRFTAGVRFRWNEFDFDGVAPLGFSTLDLYRLQIPLNYWHAFGEQWKLWVGAEPGFFTDFKEISGDDFAASAMIVAAYEWRPQWSLSFGAYYSRDLGEDKVLPVIGVIWRPNPHWNLSATFPRFRVAYAPDEQWNFDITVRPGGSGWNIQAADGRDLNFEYKSWRASLGVERLLTTEVLGRIYLFSEVGIGFSQDLKVTDNGDEIASSDLAETLMVSIGLRLRF
jgi:hypothetical protein